MSSYVVNSYVERLVYLTWDGFPVVGLTSAAVTLLVKKPGQDYFTTVNLAPSNWSDMGGGFYQVTFDPSLTGNTGTLAYHVHGGDFNNTAFGQIVLMSADLASYQQSYFQDTAVERTVYLELDSLPATGVSPASVMCKIKKTGQTLLTTKVLSADSWKDLGGGFYNIKFSPQDMSRVGTFTYTLSGTGFDNFKFESFSVLPSTDATLKDKCVVRGKFVSLSGAGATQMKVTARAIEFPARSGNRIVSGDIAWTQLAYDGSFELPLLRGATVVIEVARAGIRHQIDIPEAPTAELTDLLPPAAVNYN